MSACAGVLVFGQTRADCSDELRSALVDWVLLGIQLGHSMPVLAGIDLNQEPTLEPVGTL
ncbi:MAG: type II toxin-antitoxin system HicB family antitoxin [Acidobacteriia bacterium]|nr:type II toxin-antitoxin system HicB family antitoxin [Terriglobia bacterium]